MLLTAVDLPTILSLKTGETEGSLFSCVGEGGGGGGICRAGVSLEENER